MQWRIQYACGGMTADMLISIRKTDNPKVV
jgi:hypothetical protein